MERLRDLIHWYMKQYGYTRKEAIASIKADLKDLQKQ